MYRNKFKNSGSFMTSALLSAAAISIHVAGLQLLIANQNVVLNDVVVQSTAQAAKVAKSNAPERIDTIVVTASRL
jgi:hypothetical protein